MLGNLIGGFITILVGVSLMPAVADDVYLARYGENATESSNLTGAAGAVLGLTPLFFALGIMSVGVAIAVSGLKNAGIM